MTTCSCFFFTLRTNLHHFSIEKQPIMCTRKARLGWKAIGSALILLLSVSRAPAQTTGSDSDLLCLGYRQMYNLDFQAAHQSFQMYKQAHPQDPLGPVSNAAAYLFSEFNRLHILEADLFTDDRGFKSREQP